MYWYNNDINISTHMDIHYKGKKKIQKVYGSDKK